MQTIGFKNFRRFEELKPLDLSGVTFFVGGNNAGKSTVVKAMMLMHDNICRSQLYSNDLSPIFRLGTDGGKDVHVGTFGRALHKPYPEVREIELQTQIGIFIFRYVIGGDVESQRLNADIHILEIQNQERTWSILVDYNKGIISFKCPEYEIKNVLKQRNRFAHGIANVDSETDKLQEMLAHIDGEIAALRNDLMSADEIKKVLIEREIKNKEAQKTALQSQSKSKKSDMIIEEELQFTSEDAQRESHILSMMTKLFEQKIEEVSNVRSDSLDARAKNEALIKKYTTLQEWLKHMRMMLRAVLNKSGMVYIPSHAVAQKVFFSREDRNDYMSDVIGRYQSMNFKDGSLQRKFVQEWMKNFGIGLDFMIESIQGEAFTITITNMNGEDVPLADLGMGSIQIILLLLKLATLIEDGGLYPGLVIIEEPEQNIHPKLQSKLAELFESVHREYKLRFLIETHSEYMIRKTQAMIATEKVSFDNNPFKVYYFPEDGEPYDMVYQQSGMFENKFDEGFFDEASKQQFSVIKKAREIQHV